MDCATDSGFTELCLDGSFEYTPDAEFVGDDTFTYQVSNGGATQQHGDGDDHRHRLRSHFRRRSPGY